MAIKTTLKFVRPSTDVGWNEPLINNETLRNYWTTTYRDSGKITEWSKSDSEDGLTRTMLTTFVSSAARIEYQKDSTIQAMLNTRDQYNIDNGISIDISDEEV